MPGQHWHGTESSGYKFSQAAIWRKMAAFSLEKKMRASKQKNIRLPLEMLERLQKYVAVSGYTITQVWLDALDDYLTARGY